MEERPCPDALVRELNQYRREMQQLGDPDPFILPFPGNAAAAPDVVADKFTDLDADFGAAITLGLNGEYGQRREALGLAVARCESPIEARFLLALLCSCALNDLSVSVTDEEGVAIYSIYTGVHGDMALRVCSQAQVGPNRVDFLLRLVFTNPDFLLARLVADHEPRGPETIVNRLIVECDGHAFHERTPAQARGDKLRDRYLLNHQSPVMRFTGSEICRSPLKCADEVVRDFFEINKPRESLD